MRRVELGTPGDSRGAPRVPRNSRVRPTRTACILAAVAMVLLLPGCAWLQEVGAVRNVGFSLHQVSDVRLVGVDLRRIQRFEDLGIRDVARLSTAFGEGELPLSLTIQVRADNPDDNPRARLTALRWDLLLRDRETVSGAVDEEVVVEPGTTEDVALRAEVDLREFFEGSLRDLAEVALALTRDDLTADHLQLRVHPEVQTPLGPVRYPEPLVLSPGRD